jgi:hypothetical protein
MALKDFPPRILLLFFIGIAITVLFIKAAFLLSSGTYGRALMFSVVGAGVAIAFFRRRLMALALIALSFILVNFGMTALFHPTPLGILCTVGAAVSIYFIVRWHARKFPHLTGKDWQILFDNHPDEK